MHHAKNINMQNRKRKTLTGMCFESNPLQANVWFPSTLHISVCEIFPRHLIFLYIFIEINIYNKLNDDLNSFFLSYVLLWSNSCLKVLICNIVITFLYQRRWFLYVIHVFFTSYFIIVVLILFFLTKHFL